MKKRVHILQDRSEKREGFSFSSLDFQLAQSQTQDGTVWEATFLSSGLSRSTPKYLWKKEVLRQSAPKFDNVKVFAHRDGPHVPTAKKATREIVGITQAPRFEEEGDIGKIKGQIVLLPSAKWLTDDLLALKSRGLEGKVYRLSMDGEGEAEWGDEGGQRVLIPAPIDSVEAMAVVPFDAANAGFERLIQSADNNNSQNFTRNKAMKEKILFLFSLVYPTYLIQNGIDGSKVDENELFTHLMNADKAQPRFKFPGELKAPTPEVLDTALATLRQSFSSTPAQEPPQSGGRAQSPSGDNTAALQQSVGDMQATMKELKKNYLMSMLSERLAESKLPEPIRQAIRTSFKDREFNQADVDGAIKANREAYASFIQSAGPNLGHQIDIGMEERDRLQLALDGFYLDDPNSAKPLTPEERKEMLKGVPRFTGIRQAYVTMTGDHGITGIKDRKQRLTQSITTADFDQAAADAMNKRLVREYTMADLNDWRKFSDVVPVNDFKAQHRIRYGGFPNLATVAQGAAYPPMTSPTDEEATYTPAKKGGTELITREMIMNDDVGATLGVPRRMARAAAQTLYEFVFNLVNPATNPTVYDSVALYHANHNNTATTALGTDGVAFLAAYDRMRKQTQAGSSKRLGIRGGFMLLPVELAGSGYKTIQAAFGQANAVPQYFQQLGVQMIIVKDWTDATDWALVARREDGVGLEVGFVSGREEPELFVSDLPNAGSWFTNDAITYKIRHEYGAAITDYRFFDGSIVA